jgi:hypothetical protein
MKGRACHLVPTFHTWHQEILEMYTSYDALLFRKTYVDFRQEQSFDITTQLFKRRKKLCIPQCRDNGGLTTVVASSTRGSYAACFPFRELILAKVDVRSWKSSPSFRSVLSFQKSRSYLLFVTPLVTL